MIHTKAIIEEKEVIIFSDPLDQEFSHQAVEIITKNLTNAQVRYVFDNLGLIHTTTTEVTLYSLNGEIETIYFGSV